MENKNFLAKIFSFVKSIFLNGMFAIFPIAVTIFILNFTYNITAKWLEPLRRIEPELLQRIPGSEFLVSILFILLIGILSKFLIIGPIVHHFERLISKIPIINTVYSSAKTLINFFNIPDPTDVQRKVILINYPNKEYFNIAFLIGSAKGTFELLIADKKKDEEYFKVFMPNTPNPSSGYFFILPKSEIIETNITFEEAIKTIVSCGLITPESIKS